DSRRFEGIDADFKELANAVQQTPNVVEATNKVGLFADLLDILSNGTNPQQVEKHLSKLFDNMAKMQFDADEEERPAQSAVGVFSREEEYVPFSQPCEYTGQVALTCTQIWWTSDVGMAFSRLEEGYDNAMKEFHRKQ
ncbi:hypothetical protein JOQ06_029248, partial [Pogonophryne albipinna]